MEGYSATAPGITGLQLSGHLAGDKWQSSAEDLIELLISLLPQAPQPVGPADTVDETNSVPGVYQ